MPVSANLDKWLDKAYQEKTLAEILTAPPSALSGVTERHDQLLREAFRIRTVRDLGRNRFFRQAQVLVQLQAAARRERRGRRRQGARAMRDRQFREQTVQQIDDAHVAPLNDLVRRLREERGDGESVPWFDPSDAGTDALILVLDDAPGRRGDPGDSGFASVLNDEPTAELMYLLLEDAGLKPDDAVYWNAVPWYDEGSNGDRAAGDQEALAALEEVVALLPNLRVVVLLGSDAEEMWTALDDSADLEVDIVVAPHPDPEAVEGDPEERRRLTDAFALAGVAAGHYDE
jgi:hypothetical protein